MRPMATVKRDRRRLPGADQLPPTCRATNRFGKPCQRTPVIGATVCATHGARSPIVRAAADRRVAEAATEHRVGVMLARMNLDADPVHDPAAALARMAGRYLSGFEQVQGKINAAREANRIPSDADMDDRKFLAKELRTILTDMTRLQVGVQLASRYGATQDGHGDDLGADQAEVVAADLPDILSIVSAVLETEHRLETDRLVKVEQAKAQGQLPAGLQMIQGEAEAS